MGCPRSNPVLDVNHWLMNDNAVAALHGVKLMAYETGQGPGRNPGTRPRRLAEPRFRGITTSGLKYLVRGWRGIEPVLRIYLRRLWRTLGDWQISDNPWDLNQPREPGDFRRPLAARRAAAGVNGPMIVAPQWSTAVNSAA